MPTPRPSLLALAAIVTRDSNLTFGGGSATAEVLRRSFLKRGWQEDGEHRKLYAVSRLTPGTNLLAYATGAGWQIRGPAGALVAWLSASVPASIVAVLATVSYEWLSESPTFSAVVLIATAIAIVLLVVSAWHLAKPHLIRRTAIRSAVVVATALALSFVDMTPFGILLIAAVLGAAWPSETV